MKKILILLLLICSVGNAQELKNFFKYSTFYTSLSMNTSYIENQDYIAIDKGYIDVTEVNPYDYNLTIGIRKIARFDYEYKVKTWYYGTERAVADNVTIGNANGWEYLFNYSFIRNRGETFTDQNYWIRYLGNKCVTKVQYKDNQRVDLTGGSNDNRVSIGGNGASSSEYDGGVFEILFYNALLSDIEINTIERYLTKKYGL